MDKCLEAKPPILYSYVLSRHLAQLIFNCNFNSLIEFVEDTAVVTVLIMATLAVLVADVLKIFAVGALVFVVVITTI
jgi:hypothetical protein